MRRITRNAVAALAALLTLALWIPCISASGAAASITIHKLETDTGQQLNRIPDGEKIANPNDYEVYEGDNRTALGDLEGINGISFTVTRVKDALKNIEDARPYAGEGAYRKTLVTQSQDGEKGIAVFEDLPYGTYLIEEEHGADYDGDTMKFLVQVPMASPRDGRLIHDIHIYPKNTRRNSSLKKEVASFSPQTPDKATWRFRWEMPLGIDGARELVLSDELDDRLALQSGKSAVIVKYSNRAGTTRTLDRKHFEVEYDKEGNAVTITIDNADAFSELAKAYLPETGKKSPTLIVELTTTVAKDAKGTIYNTGTLDFEGSAGSTLRLTPERDPYIDIGDTGGLLIYKYDGDTGKPLSGAEFALYETREDALAGINPIQNPRARSGAWPATGTDGYTLLEGIAYEDGGTSYWLVETVAPIVAGTSPPQSYNILPAPLEVKVNVSSHRKDSQVEVENRTGFTTRNPQDGQDYPAARVPDGGGSGSLPWRLGGIALLAAGGMLMVCRCRSKGSKWS